MLFVDLVGFSAASTSARVGAGKQDEAAEILRRLGAESLLAAA